MSGKVYPRFEPAFFRIVSGVSFALTMVGITAGCGGGSQSAAQPATTLSCKVPAITRQAETEDSPDRGGLQISVAPVNYAAIRQDKTTVRQVPPPPIVWRADPGSVYVERVTEPKLVVNPDQLRFLVKVTNKMPRVFYGRGTVVQFNVGGKLQAVDQVGYASMHGLIVPPRQESQIEIVGPPLSSLTEPQGTIGVFLYDVVTNQSKAGEVTEKQNFEWYFDYVMRPQQQEAQVTRTSGPMPIAEYQQAMMKQQIEAAGAMYPGPSGQRYGPGTYPPGYAPPPQ